MYRDSNTNKFRVTEELPEGRSGKWTVQRFTVTPRDEEHQRMISAFHGSRRYVPAGEYTALKRIGDFSGCVLATDAKTKYAGTIVMSDTPDEISDSFPLYYAAKGNVLINGLGLGCTVKMCMSKPEVTHVTVVEIDPDVITLTGNFWKEKYGDRLTIINANAYEYKPPKGSRFGAVWHDIWDSICPSNLPEMTKLHRKYGRMATWQDSWAKGLCKSL
jgi:hypothetical protein